jgi:hypothetical protein
MRVFRREVWLGSAAAGSGKLWEDSIGEKNATFCAIYIYK